MIRAVGRGGVTAMAVAAAVGCSSGQLGDTGVDLAGSGSSSASGGATPTTSTPSSSTAGGSTSGTSGSSGALDTGSSGAPAPVCGNRDVEPGEQCDDGNDSDLDECTTRCTVSTCTDGLHSGTETDLDCGGACQPCGLCGGCVSDDDCGSATTCDMAGMCNFATQVEVDWLAQCSTNGSVGVTVPSLPAGTLRATAIDSAGTVWDPPYAPPTRGWAYLVTCDQFTAIQMRTPSGTWYADPGEAFANIGAPTEEFDFLGGDLFCFLSDSNCPDNHGSVIFSLSMACDSA